MWFKIKKMVFNKKAISPVVATALLLVVAVVAVVGFQTWFNTYQSGLNSKVEQESAAGSSITIERLEGTTTGVIYVKNTATADVLVTSWKVTLDGATVCENTTDFNATASSVVNSSPAPSCTMTTGNSYGVVVITSNGVYSATQLAR